MHVTDLAINQSIGMTLAPEGRRHLLELPESPLLLNHVGTVHASVQFALAEACSGEFLLRATGFPHTEVFAVLRASEVKFRKPANGLLRVSARFAEVTETSLSDTLTSRGRALVSVLVEVFDLNDVTTMTGRYDWFLQRGLNPP